jgi:adenine-specific DNA-methyltransferase
MLKLIVSSATDAGDLVLDPFCGSGTTLQAANELGRSWIGIDKSIEAAQATIDRLRKGVAPMGDYIEKRPSPDLFNEIIVSAPRSKADFSVLAQSEVNELYLEQLNSIVGS